MRFLHLAIVVILFLVAHNVRQSNCSLPRNLLAPHANRSLVSQLVLPVDDHHRLPAKTKDVKVNGRDSSEESSEESGDLNLWGRFAKLRFVHGFLAAISLIIGMELGDKTFFIAAIMSMRHSRWTVFVAAISALIAMTLLSVGLGLVANFVPRWVTHFASVALFLIFGIKMVRDGYVMTEEEAKEEYEEVNKKLAKREASKTEDIEYTLVASNSSGLTAPGGGGGGSTTQDPETGVVKSLKPPPLTTKLKRKLMQYISLIFIETFVMTFLAEWGDRSQIATIALAANQDTLAVTLGAIIGHSICTGLAVIGGRFIAQMISVKTVTIIGGIIFIFFAILAIFVGSPEESGTR